ncbi:unnamed protein product [Chrysoparadoxa australica]
MARDALKRTTRAKAKGVATKKGHKVESTGESETPVRGSTRGNIKGKGKGRSKDEEDPTPTLWARLPPWHPWPARLATPKERREMMKHRTGRTGDKAICVEFYGWSQASFAWIEPCNIEPFNVESVRRLAQTDRAETSKSKHVR